MSQLSEEEIDGLKRTAKTIRRETLRLLFETRRSHIGGSFSMVEILVALYFRCLSHSPDNPEDSARDRFLLSKGHGCPSFYVTLAHRGFLSKEELRGFAVDGGVLEQHPTRHVRKGIEVSSGSLGHGLSVAAGMAIAGKRDGSRHRVFTLLSDGDLNEGSTWEAAMFASHHGLDNLVAIVDYNKVQALGTTKEVVDLDPLAEKWRSFGWQTEEIDGHDFKEILDALERVPFARGKPSAIIAHTVKGKGVSFMEGQVLWHYRCPDEEEYARAMEELS